MKKAGRCVFYPIPVIVRGRSVRLSGDGPSSWTDWLVPARTKTEKTWGTLPGMYEGNRGSIDHMGGKPLNAMCRIVEDYTREGDTVLDFCMGAATTAIAALRTGRRFIGIECDPAHYATAIERITNELAQGDLFLGHNASSLATAGAGLPKP
jgi:DNA modification methylase